MKKQITLPEIPQDFIVNRIYLIRNQKVILDVHLAQLYGVQTRALKQAVRRNMDLFPPDFMFSLTATEIKTKVSQTVIPSNQHLGGSAPFAFTEGGVAMLSSVLKSKKAKQMNIAIMRAFVFMRKVLLDNNDLRLLVEEIRKKTDKNSKNIKVVFKCLDELLKYKAQPVPRKLIGFKADLRKKDILKNTGKHLEE
ncbi:MAG TPA: ORF6N domain-containing protein [Bacteroidia bacterium]|nr:ORF6N domain-containing protein [Bacteroidia bacterium]